MASPLVNSDSVTLEDSSSTVTTATAIATGIAAVAGRNRTENFCNGGRTKARQDAATMPTATLIADNDNESDHGGAALRAARPRSVFDTSFTSASATPGLATTATTTSISKYVRQMSMGMAVYHNSRKLLGKVRG
jgi:hypothetical protein